MKTMKRKFWAIPMVALALFTSVSCTSDGFEEGFVEQPIEQPEEGGRVARRAVMNLQGGIIPFDAAATRAESVDWENGAKVYLQFSVGTSKVDGVATYNDSTMLWVVEYYGDLSEGVEAKCEAYYFENAGTATYTNVVLTEHTAIYTDKEAVYMLEDNVLVVLANLTPMTGRIRMKGDSGQSYRFSGIKHYNSYNITTNSFTAKERIHISTVAEDGYSPYYYGFFPDEEEKEICFDDMASGISLTKTLDDKVLAVGRSGYLNIPTMNKRSGWKILTKDITVDDVTFRMIRVLYTLSSEYSDGETPYFYIGETEVTQELWNAVMGVDNNPSTFIGDDLPVNNLSYNGCTDFISKLIEKTGQIFRFPSRSEWVYAAQGGCASKGYTYSGGDNADDVAWYSENSDATTHPVKTKLPNEIGIYDMSGNIQELLDTFYKTYYGQTGFFFSYGCGGYGYDGFPDRVIIEFEVGHDHYASGSTIKNTGYSSVGLRIAINDIE